MNVYENAPERPERDHEPRRRDRADGHPRDPHPDQPTITESRRLYVSATTPVGTSRDEDRRLHRRPHQHELERREVQHLDEVDRHRDPRRHREQDLERVVEPLGVGPPHGSPTPRSSGALQLPVPFRVPLADAERPQPERHRHRADHEQRPDVATRARPPPRRSGSRRGSRAARRSRARSSRAPASSPAAPRPGSRRPRRRAAGPARRSRAACPSPARSAAGPRSSSRSR